MPFPVVGVGASAGGLSAFQGLLAHLPADPGVALVLIPHLDPSHESLMPEILTKSTKMPVLEAEQDLPVEINRVYIIKANTSISISEGHLHIGKTGTAPGGGRNSIDHFLMSLALDQRERAIGIILSGTASDGAAGIKAIKGEGGITFAQDDSAEFQGMPHSAIATGGVDFVLPPQEMARELVRMAKHPYVTKSSAPPREADEKEGSTFRAILTILEEQSRVPFLSYKSPTLERRIARRMALHQIESLAEYRRYLKEHPQEARLLHDELLINVTSFFREPALFQALKATVFPALLEKRPANTPLRVWVPGCSTGEEAYSLGISLVEYLDERESSTPIQIFASDVSEPAIAKARAGVYPSSIVADVSGERLRGFFTPVDGHYQISKRIRDLVLFARQDMTQDPPFSHLDILSCRNVLIYLGAALHRRVLPLFHYALRPEGFLILGASESADRFSELFRVVDAKHRIYGKIAAASQVYLAPIHAPRHALDTAEHQMVAAIDEQDVVREADRFLIGKYVPAGIIVSESGQVIEVRGDVSRFLRVPSGKPNWQLERMAREELLAELETALHQAREKSLPVRRENLELRSDGNLERVNVDVFPLETSPSKERYFALIFESGPSTARSSPPAVQTAASDRPSAPGAVERENARLRQALATQQEYQQSIIEKLETANEELRSSHEEVLSANEELQSTNEELQTAKEELQSSNEELLTLNDELRNRNLELGQTNDDLHNVLSSIQIPMAIVDARLRIRRITPPAERLLGVGPPDPDRRIVDSKPMVEIPNLETLLRTSIDNLSVLEQEVRDQEGKWWLLRIRPYRTLQNKIDGSVLTLLDVDQLKRASIQSEEGRVFSEALVEAMRDPFLVLSGPLQVKQANEAYLHFFHVRKEEVEGKNIFGLAGGQWDIPSLRKLIEEVLPKNTLFKDFQVERVFPGVGRKILLLHARQVKFATAEEPMILLSFEDATARKDTEKRMQELNAGLEKRVNERTSKLEGAKGELEAFTYSVAHDLRAPLRAMSGFGETLLEDYVGKPLDDRGREYLERLVSASRRMDRLILDLLAYSRLSRSEVALEPVALDRALRGALENVAADLEGQKGEVTIAPPMPRVLAHPTTLDQVLTNLLSNALKFVAPGTRPQVAIRAEDRDGRVRLWIEDNGIGIAGQYKDRVFRVFERLNEAEKYPGTGIGLAIVKKAMDRMGGEVGFESEVGRGSRFWIELRKDQR